MEKEEEKRKTAEKETREHEEVLDVRKVRESLGMSLDEISRVTRISTPALEAIEKDDFGLLPEPVYARSFIEAYAKIVGIESEEILSRYNSYIEREKSFEKPKKPKKQSWLGSHASIIVWCIVVFAVIFFFVVSYLNNDSERTREIESGQAIEKPEGVPDRGEVPLTEGAEREAAPEIEIAALEKAADAEGALPEGEATESEVISSPSEGGQEVVQREVSEETYLLEIKATESTWLEIREDESDPLEVLLKPGETIKREAKTKFSLIVGNAKGVDITFDGKSLGRLGRHGEVILLTLPRDAGN
jgi:cytoskeletal protein RodZ